MTLTTLPYERSLSSSFTTFAHVASHASPTRWRLGSRQVKGHPCPCPFSSLHRTQAQPHYPLTQLFPHAADTFFPPPCHRRPLLPSHFPCATETMSQRVESSSARGWNEAGGPCARVLCHIQSIKKLGFL